MIQSRDTGRRPFCFAATHIYTHVGETHDEKWVVFQFRIYVGKIEGLGIHFLPPHLPKCGDEKDPSRTEVMKV